MQIDPDYIAHLTVLEITGTIEEEEKKVLQHLIAESTEANDVYNNIHRQYSEDRMQQLRNKLDQHLPPDNIIATARKRTTRTSLITGATAAAACLLGVILYFALPADNEQNASPSLNAALSSGNVALQLGNGQTIDLSSQQGQIKAGNTVLNNNNNKLAYSGNGNSTQKAILTVPNGKDYTIQLPDGSEVQLNAATRLEFPMTFSGNTREITLSGEAYLSIKQDPARPFIVHLPHGTVQVLGTAFNINTYNQQADKISLVEGAVKVKSGTDSSTLQPGYRATATVHKTLAVDKFDPYDVLAWRKGIYLFNEASAEEVSHLIQRYYGLTVKLEITGKTPAPFTGVIDRTKPVSGFLEGLKFTGFITDYRFDQDSVLHLK